MYPAKSNYYTDYYLNSNCYKTFKVSYEGTTKVLNKIASLKSKFAGASGSTVEAMLDDLDQLRSIIVEYRNQLTDVKDMLYNNALILNDFIAAGNQYKNQYLKNSPKISNINSTYEYKDNRYIDIKTRHVKNVKNDEVGIDESDGYPYMQQTIKEWDEEAKYYHEVGAPRYSPYTSNIINKTNESKKIINRKYIDNINVIKIMY